MILYNFDRMLKITCLVNRNKIKLSNHIFNGQQMTALEECFKMNAMFEESIRKKDIIFFNTCCQFHFWS